ncbi:MAG: transglutaminase family protein, partial [Pseudomonadota bacterium]
MMRRLALRHETRYAFDAPVALGTHQLMLRPREGPDLRIETAMLEIDPPALVRWARDPLDNDVATATFDAAHAMALRIVSEVSVCKYDAAPLDFVLNPEAMKLPFAYGNEDAEILTPFFANRSEASRKAARAWASGVLGGEQRPNTQAALDRLCLAVKRGFAYEVREEPGVQLAEETLKLGSGSCRDFANLLIEAARAYGLAARFVSGYRYEAGLPDELGSTHAWAEIFLPGPGWTGFDPTIGGLADWRHIAAAVARSPTDAPPVA